MDAANPEDRWKAQVDKDLAAACAQIATVEAALNRILRGHPDLWIIQEVMERIVEGRHANDLASGLPELDVDLRHQARLRAFELMFGEDVTSHGYPIPDRPSPDTN